MLYWAWHRSSFPLPWNLVTHFRHFCDQKPSNLDAYRVNLCHSWIHFLICHSNYGTFERGSEYTMLDRRLSCSQAAYWTIFKEQDSLLKSNLHNWFALLPLCQILLWWVILTWSVITSTSLMVSMKNVFSCTIKPLLDSSEEFVATVIKNFWHLSPARIFLQLF